jgi:hypothetical protein
MSDQITNEGGASDHHELCFCIANVRVRLQQSVAQPVLVGGAAVQAIETPDHRSMDRVSPRELAKRCGKVGMVVSSKDFQGALDR